MTTPYSFQVKNSGIPSTIRTFTTCPWGKDRRQWLRLRWTQLPRKVTGLSCRYAPSVLIRIVLDPIPVWTSLHSLLASLSSLPVSPAFPSMPLPLHFLIVSFQFSFLICPFPHLTPTNSSYSYSLFSSIPVCISLTISINYPAVFFFSRLLRCLLQQMLLLGNLFLCLCQSTRNDQWIQSC